MKYSIIVLMFALLASNMLFSQTDRNKELNLFDEVGGIVSRQVPATASSASSIVSVNPRLDDVVWRKVLVRTIDLRERQNYPLYFPDRNILPSGTKNLFAIIFKNLMDGNVKAYKDIFAQSRADIPLFNEEFEFSIDSLCQEIMRNESRLEGVDAFKIINALTPAVIQYYIQEIWYFDKSTSSFNSKIIAIAPFYDQKYNKEYPTVLRSNILFWMPFDQLRPYLQEEQVAVSTSNQESLVSFDDFLALRMFNSYIYRDMDIKSIDINDNERLSQFSEEEKVEVIRREQQRIENEILNFEQDLWQY